MKAARALLLAAGHGRRAGGPKAWGQAQGGTLLERQIGFLTSLFAPDAVSVAIQKEWLERCAKIEPRIRWVAVDPDRPPMASLLALLSATPAPGWATVHHVDMPVWERALFEALDARLPEAQEAGADAVVPAFGGRRGHPVFLSPAAQDALRGADPAKDRLDFWLRGRKVLAVEVPHACVLENFNEAAAAEA